MGLYDSVNARPRAAKMKAFARLISTVWLISLNLGAAPEASAQASGVSPGAIRKEFEDAVRPLPSTDDLPEYKAPEQSIEGADAIKITIRSVSFSGNTVLSNDDLQKIAAPIIGKVVSLKDVSGVANQITYAYAKAGYPISFAFVPRGNYQQDAADIVIRVVEGYVEVVEVIGEDGGLSDNLKGMAEQLKAARPLTSVALERYLLLANDLPGRNVRAYFQAADGPVGATKVTFAVEHDALAATASVNNYGSQAVGPYRVSASTFLNNVLGEDDFLKASYTRAMQDNELQFAAISAGAFLGSEGFKLEAGATYSNSEPGTETLTAIGLTSNGLTGYLRSTYPLIRSRDLSIFLTGSFELSALRTSTSLVFESASEERGRIGRAQVDATFLDVFGGSNSASLIYSRGIDGLGASLDETSLSGTNGAQLAFDAVSLRAIRLQHLFGNVSLQLSAMGQYAGTHLLNSELCGYGGRSFGRGFDNFAISGDHCAMGSGEIQYRPETSTDWLQATFFAFSDAGYVWRRGNSAFNKGLSSAGIGVALATSFGVNASVEYAKPLDTILPSEKKDEGRILFEVSTRF